MDDLPIGFAMTLAENETAMRRFSALTGDARQQVVARARRADSRTEMQDIVRALSREDSQ